MLSAYLNALPTALITVGRDGQVIFLNQAAENLLETALSHAKSKPLSQWRAFDAKLLGLIERVFAGGESISLLEEELAFPLGRAPASLHIMPVEPAGQVDEVLISIERHSGLNRHTVSEWKQEATRTVGVMTAMLAHEVKNPLSGIRGAAQLLREEVPPSQQGLADLICAETDRIGDLLSQMEIFSDGTPVTRGPVNIHEVLQYVISIAATGFAKHIAFKELYDPSLPPVMGQRDLLVQVFLNLVKNAAEAMQQQTAPVITISTRYISGSRMRLHHGAEAALLPIAVTVEDNGPGIDPALRERLFEPFSSTKQDGKGLGLAVVAKIASDLGAVAELEPETGEGARFTVMLAAAP